MRRDVRASFVGMTHLVPTPRVDRNGRLVTRHMRADGAKPAGAPRIPTASLGAAAPEPAPAAPLPTQETITLAPEFVSAVTKRLEAANKRLDRAGMERIRWSVQQHEVVLSPGSRWGLMEVGELTDLVIDYPEIKTATHDFIGSMTQEEAGVLTRLREDTDLGDWRPRESWCDHCGTNRKRHATYVVRDRETGEYSQVGSSCLEGYLGVDPADLWILSYSPLKEDERRQRSEPRPESARPKADVRSALATALVVSGDGSSFISRSRANDAYERGRTDKDISTYAAVRAALDDLTSSADTARGNAEAIRREAEGRLEDVDAFIADVLASDDESEYMGNLKVLLSGESCEIYNLGTLVSAVAVYRRMHPAPVDESKVNEWLGQPGDKLKDLKASVERVRYTDGYYGRSTIVTMRTESGHELTWFANNSPDLVEGDKIDITGATVKKHDEYEGRKQTVVIRTKFAVTEAAERDADEG